MKKTKDGGITLISLIVNIIILLILAGITINQLTSDNGLFARAKQAKQNTLDAQDKEKIALSSYDKEIDTVVGDREGHSESKLINDFTIKATISGISAIVDFDQVITTIDKSNVVGYIINVNGEAKKVIEKLPYTIELEPGSTSKIKVTAIDKNENLKSSSNIYTLEVPAVIKEPLEYPILTTKGMVNVKISLPDRSKIWYELDLNFNCTASDALDKAAYDGNRETAFIKGDSKNKFYFANDAYIYYVCFKINEKQTGALIKCGRHGTVIPGDVTKLNNGDYHTTYWSKTFDGWNGGSVTVVNDLYEIYYDSSLN